MQIVIAGLLFLLSGAASLIYEVVWFRMLATSFGATGPAMAATTASFMAGLGLGSHWSARRAAALRQPAVAYGLIEYAIAGLALAMPVLLKLAERSLDVVAVPGGSPGWRAACQFVAIFGLLVIPAALMGATLPLLSQAAIRVRETSGRQFAWLYGLNTAGAAIGTLATGFWLIAGFGLTGTLRVGVFLNIAAGSAALLLSRDAGRRNSDEGDARDSQPIAPDPRDATNGDALRALQIAAFAIGFVSLGCQYLWSRALIFSFDRLKNTTYSFSIVLAVCLVGIVIGTAIAAIFSDRARHRERIVTMLCVILGAAIAVSAGALLWLPKLHDSIDPETLAVDFSAAVAQAGWRTLVVIGLPTVISGILLPLIVRCAVERAGIPESVGRLYAWNSFGCVVGSIVAAFVITPLFGLVKGLLVLAACLLAMAVARRTRQRSGLLAGATAVVAASAVVWWLPGSWALDTLLPGEHIVRSVDGTLATVTVAENARGERRISVDDVPVAGTSVIMQTDQKSLAHWGMLLADNPRTALTVGFGSGGASWSFLLHNRLEELDCVEICPDVPRAAELMTAANHGLMQASPRDPRYDVILADARAYLRTTTKSYDVIVSDCTDLRYRSSANLYDQQYFQCCREALTEGGCTVIWMPLGGLSREAFLLTLRTFASVFPDMQVFYLHNRWTHYVLLAGHRSPFVLRPERIRELLAEADVRADLEEIGFTSAEKIAATFLTDAVTLTALQDSADLNTEENPRLEFLVPRYDTGPWSAQRNLNVLRSQAASVGKLLPANLSDQERLTFVNAAAAAKAILAAQEAERETNVEAATRAYLAAKSLTPDDAAIDEALKFETLKTAAEDGNPTAWLLLGRSLMLQNNPAEAQQMFRRFFDMREYFQTQRQANNLTTVERQRLSQADAWAPTAAKWMEEARAAVVP